jgi:hypothetical protein
MQLRPASYVTFALAACTIVSDSLYLYYLTQHHMVRIWSGVNSILLGLFMLSWSVLMMQRGGRWTALAITVIGTLNVAVGLLFFR